MAEQSTPPVQTPPAQSPVSSADAATPPAAGGARVRHRRRGLRRLLLALGPLVVAAGAAYFYVTGGRYVSTDDAYVKAGTVQVAAEVDGRISAVEQADNTHVQAGTVLFRLDPAPFQIALARADANLANTRAAIESLKAQYRQKEDELALARATEAFQARQYQRQLDLSKRKMASEQALDTARHQFDMARQQIAVLQQEAAQILAGLGGDADIPIERHPQYLAAKAARDQAALDLAHTVVRAPIAGVVGHMPQPGEYVKTGAPVVNLVSDSNVWVEANFKETELTHLRQGQQATVTVDAYPDRVWRGRVQSLSQATGSETSILPAQNATGNWVKVVQRVAVRIALDPSVDAPPLRAGMSTTVEVDTDYRRPLPGFARRALAWLGLLPAHRTASHLATR